MEKTTLTIREPVDFIALAPIVLGFQPERSLVMMTISSFSARVDLPDDDEADDLIATLLSPALSNKVRQVGFVLYDADESHELFRVNLVNAFLMAGIKVVAALEVADGKYKQFSDFQWTDLDLAGHRFTLEAAYSDKVPAPSRAALVERIKPCGEIPTKPVSDMVEKFRQDGAHKYINELTRENSHQAVLLFVDALRATQAGTDVSREAAAALAFAAWLSGNGAAAWTALDYCDPDDYAARVVTRALQKGVNPSVWEAMQ